jgi:hypothetical protein
MAQKKKVFLTGLFRTGELIQIMAIRDCQQTEISDSIFLSGDRTEDGPPRRRAGLTKRRALI